MYLQQVLGRPVGTPKHPGWGRQDWAQSSSPSAGMGCGASLEKELRQLQELVRQGGSQPDCAPTGIAGSPSQAGFSSSNPGCEKQVWQLVTAGAKGKLKIKKKKKKIIQRKSWQTLPLAFHGDFTSTLNSTNIKLGGMMQTGFCQCTSRGRKQLHCYLLTSTSKPNKS